MKSLFLILLFFVGRGKAGALLELLEPERHPEGVALHVKTRNFYPSLGDSIVFQLAQDSKFTLDLRTRFTTLETVLYRDLAEGTYFGRARILGPDGEPLSEWGLTRFQVEEPFLPKPTILVPGDRPLTEDKLTVVWPPSPEVARWQVRYSGDESFHEALDLETSKTTVDLDLSPWRGEGNMYVKVRGMGEQAHGPWSDVEVVSYNRPQYHYYSLAHLPVAEVWKAWLQIEAMDENPQVWITYRNPGTLEEPARVQLNFDDRSTDSRRIPVTDVARGAPMLITSSSKLKMSLYFEDEEQRSFGGYQVHEFYFGSEAWLSGLPEKVDDDRIQQNAIVVANLGESVMEVLLYFEVRCGETGAHLMDRYGVIVLNGMDNAVSMLHDYFPEMEGLAMDWVISVTAQADGPGLDLVGAQFNLLPNNLAASWQQCIHEP